MATVFSSSSAVLGLIVVTPLLAWGGSALYGDTGLIVGLIFGIGLSVLGSFHKKKNSTQPQHIGKGNAPPTLAPDGSSSHQCC